MTQLRAALCRVTHFVTAHDTVYDKDIENDQVYCAASKAFCSLLCKQPFFSDGCVHVWHCPHRGCLTALGGLPDWPAAADGAPGGVELPAGVVAGAAGASVRIPL